MTNFYEETERQRPYYQKPYNQEQNDSNHSESLRPIQTVTEYSDLPFWRWDLTPLEHEIQYDVNAGFCCFNHAIGCPAKGDRRFPIFDYERELFDAVLMHKRVWVKKATGLGVTEFMLRFMAWLALSPASFPQINGNTQNSIFTIVTGPRIDLAIDLINRLKHLFENITFEDKNTVLNLGNVKIEAFPSHHLDAMRGLPNVKFIFLDEADFFPKGQQQEARTVSERYIGKSDAYIAMVSTPNMPGGLFESIETEPQSLYHKVILGWQRGLDRIYTDSDIEQAKRSPSFEREYNLKYLGHIGNVFDAKDIDAALIEYEIVEYLDDLSNPPRIQAVMGLDPGWGSSNFGIVVTHFVDGHIRVVYADQHSRQDHNEMVSTVWDLIQRYNVTKVLVDASAPSFIRALKLQWGERADYENVDKEHREYMLVEPVAFGMEHKQLLYHAKFMLENRYLEIHPSLFDRLVTSIRSAWAKDGVLDKEVTAFDDILDAFRLCLRPYKERSA